MKLRSIWTELFLLPRLSFALKHILYREAEISVTPPGSSPSLIRCTLDYM
jgi:hypothetical protein